MLDLRSAALWIGGLNNAYVIPRPPVRFLTGPERVTLSYLGSESNFTLTPLLLDAIASIAHTLKVDIIGTCLRADLLLRIAANEINVRQAADFRYYFAYSFEMYRLTRSSHTSARKHLSTWSTVC